MSPNLLTGVSPAAGDAPGAKSPPGSPAVPVGGWRRREPPVPGPPPLLPGCALALGRLLGNGSFLELGGKLERGERAKRQQGLGRGTATPKNGGGGRRGRAWGLCALGGSPCPTAAPQGWTRLQQLGKGPPHPLPLSSLVLSAPILAATKPPSTPRPPAWPRSPGPWPPHGSLLPVLLPLPPRSLRAAVSGCSCARQSPGPTSARAFHPAPLPAAASCSRRPRTRH